MSNRTADKTAERTCKPYVEIVRQNIEFLKYYKLQNIVSDEQEWKEFVDTLREDLPTAFRVTGFKDEAKALMHIIETEMFAEYGRGVAALHDTSLEKVQMPTRLSWYPDGLAYQLHLTRRDIRRSEPLFRLHNFLIQETRVGAISRQEIVSMIPPILLEIKPTDKVADLCAAPGSKTAQLIEALHSEPEKYAIPPGFIVANDVDNNRCYMLVHQAKRLNSPCFLVANTDAATFPNLTYTKSDGSKEVLKFDKILCDVPCSGDGTLRKNPDIWGKWRLIQSYNLSGLQYRILLRGLEMLAVGGRLVYSTCSLNPMENEAVVQRMLEYAKNSIKLIDASDLVPGLKYMPGLTKWKVTSRDINTCYSSFEEVPESQHTSIRPYMFPLPEEEIQAYGLQKCLRVLPHYQNSGAFFIAVFEKLDYMPMERKEISVETNDKEEKAAPVIEEVENDGNNECVIYRNNIWAPPKNSKRRRLRGYKEDPYVFYPANDKDWSSIREYYGMNEKFDCSCLLTRCANERKRNVYFTSPLLKDLLVNNEKRIKIVNMGLKAFVRCENAHSSNNFRLTQEAVYTTVRFMDSRRHIELTRNDLIVLIKSRNPTKPPPYSVLDAATQEACKNLGVGSCVLIYRDERFLLYVVGWRGISGMRAYIDVHEGMHIMRLMGVDLTEFEVNKYQKARDEASKREQAEENASNVKELEENSSENDAAPEDETIIKSSKNGANMQEIAVNEGS